mgnify:CR=1 FL=1
MKISMGKKGEISFDQAIFVSGHLFLGEYVLKIESLDTKGYRLQESEFAVYCYQCYGTAVF